MGPGPASGPGQRPDAARLIGVDAAGEAGVDMRHPLRPAAVGRRIEISVEHAGPAELELDARSLADLDRRPPEALRQLARRHADQVAADLRRLLNRPDRLRRRRLHGGARGTGGEGKDGEGDDTAHGPSMAAPTAPGKLAAGPSAR